jgi:hypothetical protein
MVLSAIFLVGVFRNYFFLLRVDDKGVELHVRSDSLWNSFDWVPPFDAELTKLFCLLNSDCSLIRSLLRLLCIHRFLLELLLLFGTAKALTEEDDVVFLLLPNDDFFEPTFVVQELLNITVLIVRLFPFGFFVERLLLKYLEQ